MLTSVTVVSRDLRASRRFYDALFEAMELDRGVIDERGRLVYVKDGQTLIVTGPVGGDRAGRGSDGTIAMVVASSEMATAWHAEGVANGGESTKGAPGTRLIGGRNFFAAYLLDPDGNRLCALHPVGPDPKSRVASPQLAHE